MSCAENKIMDVGSVKRRMWIDAIVMKSNVGDKCMGGSKELSKPLKPIMIMTTMTTMTMTEMKTVIVKTPLHLLPPPPGISPPQSPASKSL